jgi:hypothetical protein
MNRLVIREVNQPVLVELRMRGQIEQSSVESDVHGWNPDERLSPFLGAAPTL